MATTEPVRLTARQRLVRGYTMSIYIDGTRSFTGHNDTPTISASYHADVRDCAAGILTTEKIDAALNTNRITEDEYRDTLARIGTPPAEFWNSTITV